MAEEKLFEIGQNQFISEIDNWEEQKVIVSASWLIMIYLFNIIVIDTLIH